MTSISSPIHSGVFNFESKFQNNLFIFRMAIQCRPINVFQKMLLFKWRKEIRILLVLFRNLVIKSMIECAFLWCTSNLNIYSRRNGNTIKPNLYSDGTFIINPSIFDVSMQNGSLNEEKEKKIEQFCNRSSAFAAHWNFQFTCVCRTK